MALPPLSEDILRLIAPGLTPTQVVVLKLAASLIAQDEAEANDQPTANDPRLRIQEDEWDLVPDRFEVWGGILTPKEWRTPNRLAANAHFRSRVDELVSEGVPEAEAWSRATKKQDLNK